MGSKKPAKRGYLWMLLMVLIAAAIGFFWFVRSGDGPSLAAKPGSAVGKNVLLITLDTLRADKLGCYGCEEVRTPVIDGLASAGTRFTDAVAPTPITLPSHTTIMTGLYPPRHGVRDNGKFRLGDKHLVLAEQLGQRGYATAAFIAAFVLDNRFGLSRGFDVYNDQMPDSRKYSCFTHGGSPQRPGNLVTDNALKWLEKRANESSEEPFFAWVHLFDAHTPYEPPEPYATSYRDNPYLGEIAFVDKQVGRLIEFLRERSLLNETLIVIAGDHGEGLGEHNEDTHSRLIYDSTMRVPLIWHCPSILEEPNVVSDRVVSLADVAPTILDLLGLKVPREIDGISLLNHSPPANRAVYIETLATQLNHGWSPLYGLRRLGDKYIEAPTPEYYNLVRDPDELENIYSKSSNDAIWLENKMAEVRSELEAAGEDAENQLTVDMEAANKLASLGYITTEIGGKRDAPADPKDMMLLLRKNMKASSLLNLGRFAESAAIYREVVKESPDDGAAWAAYSLALGQQSKLDEAIEAILQAIRLQPEQRHWIYLARLQLEKDDEEAFLTSLQQAEQVVPGDGEIPLLRGERLLRNKNYSEAIRYFDKAREIDPNRLSVSSYVMTGNALVEQGNIVEGRSAYDRALQLDPNNLLALDKLADLDEQNEDHERALTNRIRLQELRPTSMFYANKLSALYFKLNRPNYAVDILRTLAERSPDNPGALSNYANALLTANRKNKAIEVYRQAIQLAPGYVFARYNLAGVLADTGDVDGAIEQCRKALGAQMDFAPARKRLLNLLVQSDQMDEAIAELQNAAPRGLIDWSELLQDERLNKLTQDPRFKALHEESDNQSQADDGGA